MSLAAQPVSSLRLRVSLLSKKRRAQPLAWLAIVTPAVLIFLFGGVQPQIYLPAYVIIFVTTIVAVGVDTQTGLTAAFSREPRARLAAGPAVTLGYLVFFAAFLPLLQLAQHTTVYPAGTETAFVHLLAAGCVFLLAARSADDSSFFIRTQQVLSCLLALLTLEAIVQLALSPDRIYGRVESLSRPMGPFVNHDHFAAAVELLLPPAAALCLEADRLWQTLLWAIPPALGVFALVLAGSRGGALGGALELLLLAIWIRSRLRRRHGARRAGLSPAAIAALVGVLVCFGLAANIAPLARRLADYDVSLHNRAQLAEASWTMFRARPWAGFGLGTWEYVYPKFALFDDGTRYEFAHNEYVQWLAETGAEGVICLGLLVTIYFLTLVQDRPGEGARYRMEFSGVPAVEAAEHRQTTTVRRWDGTKLPLLIGIAGFGVHASADFLLHIPALFLLFAFISGLAL